MRYGKQLPVLFFAIAVSVLMLASCGETKKVRPDIKANLNAREMPAQESWKSTVVFTDSGSTKAVLEAGLLRVYQQSMETLLDSNVKVDFYNPRQMVSTVLTSRRGKVDDRTRNLYAYENVVVKNDSGVVLTSEELLWENAKNKIVTDKFVTITTKYERIQGYGFESDQFLRNYIIYRITYVTSSSNFGK